MSLAYHTPAVVFLIPSLAISSSHPFRPSAEPLQAKFAEVLLVPCVVSVGTWKASGFIQHIRHVTSQNVWIIFWILLFFQFVWLITAFFRHKTCWATFGALLDLPNVGKFPRSNRRKLSLECSSHGVSRCDYHWEKPQKKQSFLVQQKWLHISCYLSLSLSYGHSKMDELHMEPIWLPAPLPISTPVVIESLFNCSRCLGFHCPKDRAKSCINFPVPVLVLYPKHVVW